MSIRVLIADDHPIVRSGIRNELQQYPDLLVVGEAIDGNQTCTMVMEHRPDVLLLDINMPGMRAIDIVREIKNQKVDCRVIILTAYRDSAIVMGMLKAGVNAYLLKDEDPQIINEAIRKVMEGKVWLSQSVISTVINTAKEPTQPDQADNELTLREKEVLELICDGKKNKEISALICTSERTVEFHVSNILKKMGAKTRVEAILLAQKKGNIES
jgi:DNA-binding NarL/FixJ family response regulator